MSKSIYITGTGPQSGKSVVVLGAMELLARHGGKIGFFRPVVEDATSDHLLDLIMSRYEVTTPQESMFGATYASALDLISSDKEDELHSRILEKYRAVEHESDFVVCAGTDFRTMQTALEFDFNVEVARNLGTPLMPVVAGQGRRVGEIVDAVRVLAESLEAKRCDVLSVIVNRVAPDDVTAAARFQEDAPDGIPVFVMPDHPLLDVHSAETLAKIAAAIEPYRTMVSARDLFKGIDLKGKVPPARLIDLSVETVIEYADPAVVCVPTHGGNTARSIARFRLPIWIIAVSSQETTCQQLQFSSGVIPICEAEHPKNWNAYVSDWLKNNGVEGKLAVVTEGPSRIYPDANNRLEILDTGRQGEGAS